MYVLSHCRSALDGCAWSASIHNHLLRSTYFGTHCRGDNCPPGQARPHCWPSHFHVRLLSSRSWTGRETMSTSRLTRQCTGKQYGKWRTSQTPRRWSPAVAIRQLPWLFVTWPPGGLLTPLSSPEWVSGSNRTSRFKFWPRKAIFSWLCDDFLTFF